MSIFFYIIIQIADIDMQQSPAYCFFQQLVSLAVNKYLESLSLTLN
jgi:hypothetical protein